MTEHPAKFSQPVLERIARLLDEYGWPERVLDPFAGTGRVHGLPAIVGFALPWPVLTVGVEIEPEWATIHPRTLVANSLQLPFRDRSFDGMVTSPCLAQEHQVLTNDLRWIPVGDVEVGDELLAFDESLGPIHRGGRASRRRWRRAEVVRSEPKKVECVRVVLANGDELVTTPEHPWLANRYAHKSVAAEWVPSERLMGGRLPYQVYRQVVPWTARTSFDAGWLAGMLDGEGSLSLGVHGCPKLCCYQAAGPVADRAERLMYEFGYEPNRIVRKGTPDHYRKMVNLYVTGGFPTMLRALGELRPTRLLDRWLELDVSTRTVQAEKCQVVAVEPAGMRDIQEIETTEGTYIGEGYLMHNCFGNRMADHHDAKDDSKRYTYRHTLGRPLHSDNAGQLQWGKAYRDFHAAVWTECLRVLQPESLIVINVSNHIRDGVEQYVTEWHLAWFLNHGCAAVDISQVNTRRMRNGANRNARPRFENVFTVRYVAPVLTPDDYEETDHDPSPQLSVRPGIPNRVDPTDGLRCP